MSAFSNVVGFDDAPFSRSHVGTVPVVGTVYAGSRLDGVLMGRVEKDGFDGTHELGRLIVEGKFSGHLQLVLLHGITLAGFNVVDVFQLHENTKLPVIVVSRRQPNFERIRKALLEHVTEGAQKWDIIDRLGPMRAAGEIFIQTVGVSYQEAYDIVSARAQHGHIPEPLRTAHLVAGAVAEGESRGNA